MKQSKLDHIIDNGYLLYKSPYNSERKVFLYNNCIYKVICLKDSLSFNERMNTLKKEYEILKHLKGVSNVPQSPRFYTLPDYECLTYDFVDGVTLGNIVNKYYFLIYIKCKLLWVLIRISLKGVAHRDIKSDNIVVGRDGGLCVLDFDQACVTTVLRSLGINLFGNIKSTPSVHGSFLTLLNDFRKIETTNSGVYAISMKAVTKYFKRIFKWFVPKKIITAYRKNKIKKYTSQLKENKRQQTMLPNLGDNPPVRLMLLHKAWSIARDNNASSPGESIAYYSISDGGFCFPGERSWVKRWEYLRNATDYKGKKIVELGCNMGLLSIFLLKEARVQEALAVDVDCEILSAAQLVAGAYNVAPYFRKVDFDSEQDWDSELKAFNADIVFALNVLNWVNDKDRFTKFLFNFKEVVYEGHNNVLEECEMFEKEGYIVNNIAVSERDRTVIRAQRRSRMT